MTPRYSPHFTLPQVHRQPVAVAFDAPAIVSDTGLLTVRDLDQRLGYLADLARRLPDPRAQPFVTHRCEALLAQQVYQILADYPDGCDHGFGHPSAPAEAASGAEGRLRAGRANPAIRPGGPPKPGPGLPPKTRPPPSSHRHAPPHSCAPPSTPAGEPRSTGPGHDDTATTDRSAPPRTNSNARTSPPQ